MIEKLTSPKKRYKAVIFDCDGVLVDSEIIASRVTLELLQPYGFDMALMEYARAFAGKTEEDIMEILREEYQLQLPADFTSRVRLAIDRALNDDLRAIPGAITTIEAIPLLKAVVSNSPLVRVIHSLKVANLTEHFGKKLYAAEMVSRPKPYPDVYLYAAAQLQVQPADCLVVEDSFSGATAAKSAGMEVIGFLGASHIYNGHDLKLKEAGVHLTAKNMASLHALIQQLIR